MGRTNPTYRDTLRKTEENWQQYRRALRFADKEHFDRLFEHACAHADAAGYLNHQQPVLTLLISVALEQEKQIQNLTERVDALEDDLNTEGEQTPEMTSQGAE